MKEINEELICLCALNKTCGYKPSVGKLLIERFGSATAVYKATRQELCEAIGPATYILDQISLRQLDYAEDELRKVYANGGRFTGFTEPEFPQALLECPDHPVGLYIRSSSSPEEIFNKRPMIAVVGTRDLSEYGRTFCTKLVHTLSRCEQKPCIVSGLAFGADITAHKAALDCGLPTIAVIPTGIDDIYPFRHGAYAERIAGTEGCAIVTDFPFHTSPIAIHFIRRNRIIAGLGKATVLVESKAKGGGMITARLAFDYDREVYALPGRLDDIRSQGCNILLRDKTAEPFTSPEDLAVKLGLGELKLSLGKNLEEILMDFYRETDFGERERLIRVAKLVQQEKCIDNEAICSITGWTYAMVAALTGRLEMDGFIVTDILQRCSINQRSCL